MIAGPSWNFFWTNIGKSKINFPPSGRSSNRLNNNDDNNAPVQLGIVTFVNFK